MKKMAIFRPDNNSTNTAPLCTLMSIEVHFIIFFLNILVHTSSFKLLLEIGQTKSACYYHNRFVYIQKTIKNREK